MSASATSALALAVRLRIEENMQGEHPARNRFEKRHRVSGLPREFRIHVHQRGQWRKKIIKNGELVRP